MLRGPGHTHCGCSEPLPSGPEVASPGDRAAGLALRFGPVPQWVRDAAHPRGEGTPRGGGPGLQQGRKNREATSPWLSIWGRGWKTEGSWCPPPSKAPQAAPRESWALRGPCSDHTPTGARWMGEQGGSQSENPRPIHSTWAWSLPGPSSPRRTCALALHPRPASSPLLLPGPGPLSPRKSEPHSGLSSTPPRPPAVIPGRLCSELTLT